MKNQLINRVISRDKFKTLEHDRVLPIIFIIIGINIINNHDHHHHHHCCPFLDILNTKSFNSYAIVFLWLVFVDDLTFNVV